MEQQYKRIYYLDLMKSIAIISVVFYHGVLPQITMTGTMKFYSYYFLQAFAAVATPLFFFVNGFLLFNKELDLHKHISRIIRMMVLTVIWGGITIISLMLIRKEILSVGEFLKTLWQFKENWISHLWYMGELICIYLFFPVFYYAYQKKASILVYFVCIGAIIIFGNAFVNEIMTMLSILVKHPVVIANKNIFNMFNPFKDVNSYALIYFCCGGIIYRYQEKFKNFMSNKKWIFVAIILLDTCFLFMCGIMYTKLNHNLWEIGWYGKETIFTFINVLAIYTLCMNYNKSNKVIELISKNTLGISLIHIPVLRFIEQIIDVKIITTNICISFLYTGIVVIITLLLSLGIKKLPIVNGLLRF